MPPLPGTASTHPASRSDLLKPRSPWTQHATVHLTEMKRLQGLQWLALRGVGLDPAENPAEHSHLTKSLFQASPLRSGNKPAVLQPFVRPPEPTDRHHQPQKESALLRTGNQRMPLDPEKRIEMLRKQDLLKRQKSTLPNLLFFNPK